MAYNYNVTATSNPLSKNQLYEGLLVCFSDVQSNPNNTGVLEKRKDTGGAQTGWTAVINGVRYNFDLYGYDVTNNTRRLYGVLSKGEIDPTRTTAMSRAAVATDESTTVSLTYMTPKDYFACEALNALIQRIDNPMSMSDGTIATIAAKSYKIAQAMAKEAYGSRQNDKKSSDESGTDYVNVDELSLQTNTERILYNINESIKANTKSNKETGIKVSNIDKVKFDGTPTVKLDATSEVKVTQLPNVTINGTPNVNVINTHDVNVTNTPDVNVTNMPSQPISITGTVSVDNFPESE